MRQTSKDSLRKMHLLSLARDDPPVELGIDFGTTRTVVACSDRGNISS